MRIPFTFTHIETFLAVAETGSFRAASERLHISQPAVTARIQQLEHRTGLALLVRTTRSVQLTPEGQRLLDDARGVLAGLDDLAEALRERVNLGRGVVSLAILPSMAASILPAILRGFHARYPRITIRLKDATAQRAADMLINGEVDFAITSPPPRHGMEFFPLLTDSCVAIAAADHPLAGSPLVTLADIARHPLLLYSPGTTLRDTLDRAFERIAPRPEAAYEAHHVATLVSITEAGLGVAFVPRTMLRRINLGRCAILKLEDRSLDRTIGILKLRKPASPAANAFLAFCRSLDAADLLEPGTGSINQES